MNSPSSERRATYSEGGHCLYCGFCLYAWSGMEIDETKSLRVHSHCFRERGPLPDAFRAQLAALPAKHYSRITPCNLPRTK